MRRKLFEMPGQISLGLMIDLLGAVLEHEPDALVAPAEFGGTRIEVFTDEKEEGGDDE